MNCSTFSFPANILVATCLTYDSFLTPFWGFKDHTCIAGERAVWECTIGCVRSENDTGHWRVCLSYQESQWSNWGHQAWWQAPLPAKSFCQPCSVLLKRGSHVAEARLELRILLLLPLILGLHLHHHTQLTEIIKQPSHQAYLSDRPFLMNLQTHSLLFVFYLCFWFCLR